MNRRALLFFNSIGMWVVKILGLAIIAMLAFYFAGARVNLTRSLPQGLYWTQDKQPAKGDLVIFQPPASPVFTEAIERGYFTSRLMKKVVALAGDVVMVQLDGITVNGIALANANFATQDGQVRPLVPCLMDHYHLAVGEVYLYSDYSPNSFDSRYFGVQNLANVLEVVKPVLIYVP